MGSKAHGKKSNSWIDLWIYGGSCAWLCIIPAPRATSTLDMLHEIVAVVAVVARIGYRNEANSRISCAAAAAVRWPSAE